MSLLACETPSGNTQALRDRGRRHRHVEDSLLLTELNRYAVIDHGDNASVPVSLMTFGTVREICPKCLHPHLSLILRQRNVRTAHLFCAECESCFDAHYQSGASALTI
jgi:hypothetical protein